MAREQKEMGPRLESLLDERDHIRIKISLMEDHDAEGEVFALRQRLVALDKEIMKHWGGPPKQSEPAN